MKLQFVHGEVRHLCEENEAATWSPARAGDRDPRAGIRRPISVPPAVIVDSVNLRCRLPPRRERHPRSLAAGGALPEDHPADRTDVAVVETSGERDVPC